MAEIQNQEPATEQTPPGSDPVALAQAIGSQATPPGQPADSGSQVPATATESNDPFISRLVEATGGKVSNADQLKQVLERAQQHEALQAEYTQLKAQAQLSPFATPLVKTVNDFFANGGTEEEYYNLLDLKRIDADKTPELDLIRKQYSYQYPGMTGPEIDALIKKDVGNFEGTVNEEGGQAVVDPAVSAELKRKGMSAKEWLKQQQAAVSTPAAAIANQTAQVKEQQISHAWSSVTSFALADVKDIPLKFEGIEEGLNFPIPAEFKEQLTEAVKNYAISAFKEGKLSANQADFENQIKPALRDWATAVVYMKYGPEINMATAKHVAAATEKKIRMELGGVIPKPTVDPQRGAALPSDLQERIKAHYKNPMRV